MITIVAGIMAHKNTNGIRPAGDAIKGVCKLPLLAFGLGNLHAIRNSACDKNPNYGLSKVARIWICR